MVDRRIKAAKFVEPSKAWRCFDCSMHEPTLNKKLVLDLARSAFVDRRENIIALGPSGVGKTHVAIGIGLAACQHLASKPASPLPRPSFTNSSRPATTSGSCACKGNLPATSC